MTQCSLVHRARDPAALIYVRSEFLTVVLLKIQGLWDVTLCCSANISQHSEGTIVLQNVGTYWDLFAKPDSVTSQSALTLRPTTST